MVQLRIVLDKRTSKADGTSTIYYRVTENRKVFYLSTGYSLEVKHWDENKNIVKKSFPNAQTINTSITKRYFDIQKAIIELEDEGLFSMDSLKERMIPRPSQVTFKQFADQTIAELHSKNRVGNAIVYQTGVNSVFKFRPSKTLRFTDVSSGFVESYTNYLVEKGCKINTVGNYLRTLRAIYNKAIKAKVVHRKYYPFSEIPIRTEKTAKRAFTKEVIKAIERLELPCKRMADARAYYMLSFYLIGMNFTDMAYLTSDNIVERRVEYRRRKTGTEYSIGILPIVQEKFDSYLVHQRKYLLPILPDSTKEGSLEAKKLIQQFIKTTNKYLKRISTDLELTKPCTTYTVRHSWATIAKRLGFSKELISEALGHKQGNQITEIYLDTFDEEVIDEMNKMVID